MKPMKVIGVVLVSAALLAIAAILIASGWSWIKTVVVEGDTPMCSADNFHVESRSAHTEGVRTTVTATVRNNNPVACGVQVSVASKDKAGKQVAIEQLWAAGVGNIPAGATHTFPVYLSPEVSKQAEGGDFDVKPINARVWKQQ